MTSLPVITNQTTLSPTTTRRLPSSTPWPTNTPIPIISSLNASKVVQVARIGKGKLSQSAWSPDGKYLAVSSSLGIFLYDSQSLMELNYIRTNGTMVYISFIPEEGALLTQNEAGGVFLYRISDGMQLLQFPTVGNSISALSPKGNLIATTSDEYIILRRVSDGTSVQNIKAKAKYIKSMTFSPDGELLAAVSYGAVDIWNVSDGTLKHSLSPSKLISNIAFTSDGMSLAVGKTEKIEYYRVSDWTILLDIDIPEGNDRFVLSPDGETLATQSDNTGNINLRSISNNEILHTLNSPSGHGISYESADRFGLAIGIAFSADGKMISSEIDDNNVYIWQVSDGTLRTTLMDYSYPVFDFSISSDRSILSRISDNGKVDTLRLSDNKLLVGYWSGSNAVFSPDGSLVAGYNYYEKAIYIKQVNDGTLLNKLPVDIPRSPYAAILDMAFSHDGSLFLMLLRKDLDNTILRIWTLSDSKEIFQASAISHPLHYALSSDGKTLAVSSGRLQVREIPSGKLLYEVTGLSDNVIPDAFSPDGTLLFISSYKPKYYPGGAIYYIPTSYLINVSDGSLLNTPFLASCKSCGINQTRYINPFSPDGKSVIMGNNLIQISDGIPINILKDLPSDVGDEFYTSMVFSPDGGILAVGFDYGGISLLRVSDGSTLASLNGHTDSVTRLLFSSDGITLYSGSKDGTICVWSVAH
jgi:WD40 repeat protein